MCQQREDRLRTRIDTDSGRAGRREAASQNGMRWTGAALRNGAKAGPVELLGSAPRPPLRSRAGARVLRLPRGRRSRSRVGQ